MNIFIKVKTGCRNNDSLLYDYNFFHLKLKGNTCSDIGNSIAYFSKKR